VELIVSVGWSALRAIGWPRAIGDRICSSSYPTRCSGNAVTRLQFLLRHHEAILIGSDDHPFWHSRQASKVGLSSRDLPQLNAFRPKRLPATRKVDIRVNALGRQEEALIDCGVDSAHVIRAALRRAVKDWQLDPHFVVPSEEPRSLITEWRARRSLAVDTAPLATLLRAHDRLDVLSKWALICGKVEPRVWAEIDAIMAELYADDERSGTATVP
jgi:hypothetical protein